MGISSEIRVPRSMGNGRNSCRSQFSIGGVTVEVSGDRREDVALAPSLRAFETDLDEFDISIAVEWVGDIESRQRSLLFDSGTTWRCYEDDARLLFDFNSPVFGAHPYKRLQVDRQFERATLKMNESAFAGFPFEAEPLEYPLDELLIMHRLTQEQAIELHACGIVGADGVGNLFVGHSGAGKSTTTRLWTEREGVEVLSDDRIIVRAENNSRYCKCGDRNLSQRQRDDDGNHSIRMYGTPWHGEAMYAFPGNARLGAIFILEHGCGNRLTELASGEAVAELFARSFVPFHRHEYVDAALRFLQKVVAEVPCYRYAFEADQSAVGTILKLRH